MPKHKDIFDGDSDEDDNFKINDGYAERYDKWRYKEEYEKLKARADSLEASSDESSEEEGDGKDFGKPSNPDFDREFLMSIGTIYKHKTGDVDVKDVQFFTGDYRVEKEQEEKPMTLKDFERHVIIERGGKFEEDDVNVEDKGTTLLKSSEKIKFDDGLEDSGDDDDEGDGLLTSGLFKPKEDASEDTNEEPQNEAVEFVKGKRSEINDEKQRDVLETVKSEWSSDKLSKKDRWLVDFFLNERYMDEDDGDGYENAILDEDEMSDEDSEKEENPLAAQYKFRHQEPGDLIKRHPRNVPDTLRQKDEKRKIRREAAKERQLHKKEEKRKEIELLKAMKYKEIEEKIEKIKEASGNEDIDLGDVDLEEDFDPDAHDAYMEKILGDSYYDDCNVDEELPEFEEEIDDGNYFDNWAQRSAATDESHHEEAEEDGEEEYFDGDFNMDADYDPTQVQEVEKSKSSTRRKGRHRSKFSKALEKKKPLFDPNEKDFASYFDEYYKLDFEDVVGGIPCRFKYRKVEANDFGLTTGEILTAKNSDLNRWVGLKKIMQYNRTSDVEAVERQRYRERAKHEHVKQKILPSLFDENPEEAAEREREKRRLKNLKRKQKKWKLREGIEGDDGSVTVNADEGQSVAEDKNLQEKTEVVEGSADANSEGDEKLKKKKKKMDKIAQVQDKEKASDQDINTNETEEGSVSVAESPKKKKKKKKIDHNDEQNISENNVVCESEIIAKGGSGDLNTDEGMMPEKKKKKKSKDQTADSCNTEHTSLTTEIENNEKETIEREDSVLESGNTKKKKKKKNKEHKDELNPCENGIVIETNEPNTDGSTLPEKKKKKLSRDKSVESCDPENAVINEVVTDENGLSNSNKKKKKSKVHTTEADAQINNEDEGKVPKCKKSKKKKEFMKGNPIKKKSKKIKNMKKMKHLIKKHKGVPYFEGISDTRLEAYGQNPKKVKNRVFYGKDF